MLVLQPYNPLAPVSAFDRAVARSGLPVIPLGLVLNAQSGFRVDGVQVVGRLVSALKPVSYLERFADAPGVFFGVVEVLGLVDVTGALTGVPGSQLVTSGWLVCACDDNRLVGQWVRVSGAVGSARTESSVRVRSSFKQDRSLRGVNCVPFSSAGGVYSVVANKVTSFEPLPGVRSLESLAFMVRSVLGSGVEGKFLWLSEQFPVASFGGLPDALVSFVPAPDFFPLPAPVSAVSSSDLAVSEGVSAGVGSGVATRFEVPDFSLPASRRDRVSRLEPAGVSPLVADFRAEVESLDKAVAGFRASLVPGEVEVSSGISVAVRNAVLSGFNRWVGSSWLSSALLTADVTVRHVVSALHRALGVKESFSSVAVRMESAGFLSFSSSGFDSPDRVFLGIVDSLVGTDFCDRQGDLSCAYWRALIVDNPYSACLFAGLDAVTADRLFFFVSAIRGQLWAESSALYSMRDKLLATAVLLDDSVSDSLIPVDVLLRGVRVSAEVESQIVANAVPFSAGEVQLLNLFFESVASVAGTPFSFGDFYGVSSRFGRTGEGVDLLDASAVSFGAVSYESLGWLLRDDRLGILSGEVLVEDLESSGLALVFNDKVMSVASARMELFIYEFCQSLAVLPTGVSADDVSRAIEVFESASGIMMEPEQREVVSLTRYRVGAVTGQAGSGKTTSVQAILRAFDSLGVGVTMCAFTARASARLSEVVSGFGSASTLHSTFGIDPFKPVDVFAPYVAPVVDSDSEVSSVLIIDESSMLNTRVLFEALSKVEPGTCVYFVGDMRQLLPIGKGVPFMSLMSFIPTVELGMSKRSAVDSGISRACDIIINGSSPDDFKPLVSSEDFRLVPADDDSIVDTVVKGVMNQLPRFGIDGFMVGSPYSHKDTPYNAPTLNKALHDVLLPQSEVLFTYQNQRYRVGARVVHTRENLYARRRYALPQGFAVSPTGGVQPRLTEPVVLQQVRSTGVVNGEVGYLVGLVRAVDTVFDFSGVPSSVFESSDSDDIPQAERSDWVYTLVGYRDDVLGDYSVAAYPARVSPYSEYTESTGVHLSFGDVSYLSLAYALTAYKEQGSEFPLQVSVLGSQDSERFVNNNMVYTMVSRGSAMSVVVGSVSGLNSTLSRARLSVQSGVVDSLLLTLAVSSTSGSSQ